MAQDFDLPDEIQKALSNHVVKVTTYNELVSEIQIFSKTVQCPHLHDTTKQAAEIFSRENPSSLHRTISLPTLKAFDSLTQEEIRKNKNNLNETDLHKVAWYKNLFFTKLKQQIIASPLF